jgi:hypothetical protein
MTISNSHLEPVFAVPIWTADLSPVSDEDRFALVVDYRPTGTSNYGIDDGAWDQKLY